MARRPVHMKKTVLTAKKRAALRASDFAVPSERKYPINDLFHARLALTYVLTPSNAAYRDEVVRAVMARYPELQFWWASRSKGVEAKRARTVVPARRKVANPSQTSEVHMPVYTLNPSHRRHAARPNPGVKSEVDPHAARELELYIDNEYALVGAPNSIGKSIRKMLATKMVRSKYDAMLAPKAFMALADEGARRYTREFDRRAGFGAFSKATREVVARRLAEKFVDDMHHGGYDVKEVAAGRQNPRRRRNGLSEDGTVVSNPRRRAGGRSAQKAGLAKGQSLMARAAAAYRAGQYPSMQAALKGVARRKNPLSEDGMVVSNPRRKGKAPAKRAGGRTAAQSDAARAMKLFHSGKASSLADAWAMIRRSR